MKAKRTGLRIGRPYKTYPAPDGLPVRAVRNERGTCLCIVLDHFPECIEFVQALIDFWNEGHGTPTQSRRKEVP